MKCLFQLHSNRQTSGCFAVITGITLLTHCLNIYVGIGSSSHDFDGDFMKSFLISSLDAGVSEKQLQSVKLILLAFQGKGQICDIIEDNLT
jgi:hypothetical protein